MMVVRRSCFKLAVALLCFHSAAPVPLFAGYNSNNYYQPSITERNSQILSNNEHESHFRNYASAGAHILPAANSQFAAANTASYAGTTGNLQHDSPLYWNPQLKHANSNNYIDQSHHQPDIDLPRLPRPPHITRQHGEDQNFINSQETFSNVQNYAQVRKNADSLFDNSGSYEAKEHDFRNFNHQQHQYLKPNFVGSTQTNDRAHYPVNTARVVHEGYASPSTYNTREIIRQKYPVPEPFTTREIFHENFEIPTVPQYPRQSLHEYPVNQLLPNNLQWTHLTNTAPGNMQHLKALLYPNGTIIYINNPDLVLPKVPVPVPGPRAPVPTSPVPKTPPPHVFNPVSFPPIPTPNKFLPSIISPNNFIPVPKTIDLKKIVAEDYSKIKSPTTHRKSHQKTVIRHVKIYPNGTTSEEIITTVVENGVPTTTTTIKLTDKNKPPVVVFNTTKVEKPEPPKISGSPEPLNSQHTIVIYSLVYPNGTVVDVVTDTIIEGNKPPKVKTTKTIHSTNTTHKITKPLDKNVRAIDALIGLIDPKKSSTETKPVTPRNDTKPSTPKNETKPDDPKIPSNNTDPHKNGTANNPKTPANNTKPGSPNNGTKPDDPKAPANETKPAPPKNATKPDDPKNPSNKTDPPKNGTNPGNDSPKNGTKPDDPKTPANKTDPPKNGTKPDGKKIPGNETKPTNNLPKNGTKPDDSKTPINKTDPSPVSPKNDTKPDDPKKPVNETKPASDQTNNNTKPENPPAKHHRLIIETHHIIHITHNRTITDNITRTEKVDDNEPVTTKDTYVGEDDEDPNDLQEGTETDVTHGTITNPTGTKSEVQSTVTRTIKKLKDGNVAEHVTIKDDIKDK